MEDVKSKLHAFILKEYLSNEKDENLTESTPLLTGGILDSIAVIKLVVFIEKQYEIKLKPEEIDVNYLDTISDIAKLVSIKINSEQ